MTLRAQNCRYKGKKRQSFIKVSTNEQLRTKWNIFTSRISSQWVFCISRDTILPKNSVTKIDFAKSYLVIFYARLATYFLTFGIFEMALKKCWKDNNEV